MNKEPNVPGLLRATNLTDGGMTTNGPSILLVGGLERLDEHYRAMPEPLDIRAVYTNSGALLRKAEHADAIVLVTGHMSPAAADKARAVARRRGIPLVSALTPSISAVRHAMATAIVWLRELEAQPA